MASAKLSRLAPAALLAGILLTTGWHSPSSAKRVTIAGVEWESSLEAAKAEARKSGKPILHLQMFGRLDDAFC